MEQKLLSFLNVTTDVFIVANDKLPGFPLVTPLLDKNNNPRTDNNGNEIGSIRLEQTVRTLNGSYMNNRRRIAFIGGTIEALNKLISDNKLTDGSKIPGKIIIVEGLSPMWKGQNPKMNPATAEVVEIAIGENKYPVFMRMTYTEDMTKTDKLLRTPEDVIHELETLKMIKAIGEQAQAAVNINPAVPVTEN